MKGRMMSKVEKIAPDATLEDVLPTLVKPEDHVATVLATMQPCRKQHGNAHVRIGITGTGKVPYHKVVYTDQDGVEQHYGSFNGLHPDVGLKVHESTWSSRSMSFSEVQSLIGEIRGYRPAKASGD
jgi:hypothetical protein